MSGYTHLDRKASHYHEQLWLHSAPEKGSLAGQMLAVFCLCGLGTILHPSLWYGDLPSWILISLMPLLKLLSPTRRLSCWCWNARNSTVMQAHWTLAMWKRRHIRPLRWTNMRQELSDKFFSYLSLARLLWASVTYMSFQKAFPRDSAAHGPDASLWPVW